MQIEQPLGDIVEPVLFVIPKRIDGPECPGLVVAELEALELARLVYRGLKPYAAAGLLVEDFGSSLDQGSLEQHLKCVLEVKQDDGGSTILLNAVESGHGGSNG